VYVKIFESEKNDGSEEVDCPSRAEVDHLQGILFRDPVYEDEMIRINREYEGANLFVQDPFTCMITPRTYDFSMVDDSMEGRVPPGTPDDKHVKIGPPGPRRSGIAALLSMAINTDMDLTARKVAATRSQSTNDFVIVSDNEGSDKAKSKTTTTKEGKGHWPFRSSIVHSNGAVYSQPTEAEMEASTPPDLGYPTDDGNGSVESGSTRTTQVGDRQDSSKAQSRAQSEDSITEAKVKDEGQIRPAGTLLSEVLEVLRKLRTELASALDAEAQRLISEVEINAGRILELKEKSRGPGTDGDGDIEMERDDSKGRTDPVPAYQSASPASPSEDSPYAPRSPTEVKVEEVEERVKSVEKEVQDAIWKAAGDESRFEDRMMVLEARMAVLEVQEAESQPGRRTTRQRAAANVYGRASKRGGKQGGGDRNGDMASEVMNIRIRMGDVERVLEGWEGMRDKVGEVDVRVARAEGEVKAGSQKIGLLEARQEEGRLRQDIMSRDIGQGKAAVNLGVLPRVSKLDSSVAKFEAWMRDVDFRLGTYEEQAGWTDQKIRGIWQLATQENAADRYLQAATVLTIWETAAKAYNVRMQNAPRNTPDPRTQNEIAPANAQRPTQIAQRVPAPVFYPASQNNPNINAPASY
jgi:hypothetical protein